MNIANYENKYIHIYSTSFGVCNLPSINARETISVGFNIINQWNFHNQRARQSDRELCELINNIHPL